jgi:hypothetical protein
MKTYLEIAGILQLALSVAHIPFARYFGWRKELQNVSLFTRQVFWVHAGFLMLVLAGFGGLSLFWTNELLAANPLSQVILAGLAIFWALRLFCQFFVYRAELWRGHAFNTVMHCVFAILWAYLTAVYATAFWQVFAGIPNPL